MDPIQAAKLKALQALSNGSQSSDSFDPANPDASDDSGDIIPSDVLTADKVASDPNAPSVRGLNDDDNLEFSRQQFLDRANNDKTSIDYIMSHAIPLTMPGVGLAKGMYDFGTADNPQDQGMAALGLLGTLSGVGRGLVEGGTKDLLSDAYKTGKGSLDKALGDLKNSITPNDDFAYAGAGGGDIGADLGGLDDSLPDTSILENAFKDRDQFNTQARDLSRTNTPLGQAMAGEQLKDGSFDGPLTDALSEMDKLSVNPGSSLPYKQVPFYFEQQKLDDLRKLLDDPNNNLTGEERNNIKDQLVSSNWDNMEAMANPLGRTAPFNEHINNALDEARAYDTSPNRYSGSDLTPPNFYGDLSDFFGVQRPPIGYSDDGKRNFFLNQTTGTPIEIEETPDFQNQRIITDPAQRKKDQAGLDAALQHQIPNKDVPLITDQSALDPEKQLSILQGGTSDEKFTDMLHELFGDLDENASRAQMGDTLFDLFRGNYNPPQAKVKDIFDPTNSDYLSRALRKIQEENESPDQG